MYEAFEIEEYIADEVQYCKQYYVRKMAQTKQKFFEFLKEEKPLVEFEKELDKIWGKINHDFMDKKLEELEKMVKNKDFKDYEKYVGKEFTKAVEMTFEGRKNQVFTVEELYKLNPESEFIKNELKYLNDRKRIYQSSLNSIDGEGDEYKYSYISDLVDSYNKFDATIPYFNADGTLKCYNTIATYNSMLYNVNLTKSAWNRTYYDSVLLDNDRWIIYPHMYSCPACAHHQGKIYTTREREDAIYDGVGHPNCKCVWYLFWGNEQLEDMETYDTPEWVEAYKTRQKLQSLNLERYRLKKDRQILKELGNEEKADEVLKKIQKLNKTIKGLKEYLPTDPDKVMQSLSTRQR